MCDTNTTTEPCGECEACCTDDLPVSPFVALRVAYGMLLGEDDFRTLMGNPRGKHMLHDAWLHGRGVVWGYPVDLRGELDLRVGPGLALDGWGRELLLDHTECVNVRDWVAHLDELPEGTDATGDETGDETGCRTLTISACLYAQFDCCPAEPVPTLAEPCDINRQHDTYSRVVERVRLSLRAEPCPEPARAYRRVRMLLGLEEVSGDEAGRQAYQAAWLVSTATDQDRPAELLRQFRCLAALDAAELRPAGEPGVDECGDAGIQPGLFPYVEDDAGVPLACVTITVRNPDECPEISEVQVDLCCRTALLPTATIQELCEGLAPGVFGMTTLDAGGPRVVPPAEWSEDGKTVRVAVTADLVPGSVKRAVKLTSLSERGWVDEDIYQTHHEPGYLVIELADPPVNDTVRLIVKGTGPTPVFGADPLVPLAGVVGGPPGTADDGHDAVLTFPNPTTQQEAS